MKETNINCSEQTFGEEKKRKSDVYVVEKRKETGVGFVKKERKEMQRKTVPGIEINSLLKGKKKKKKTGKNDKLT